MDAQHREAARAEHLLGALHVAFPLQHFQDGAAQARGEAARVEGSGARGYAVERLATARFSHRVLNSARRPRSAPPAVSQPTTKGASPLAVVSMRELLEAGVHFGHQTRRWNPKMKRFIFTERNGIYIIDLQQSLTYIDRAYAFVKDTVARGGQVPEQGGQREHRRADQPARVVPTAPIPLPRQCNRSSPTNRRRSRAGRCWPGTRRAG